MRNVQRKIAGLIGKKGIKVFSLFLIGAVFINVLPVVPIIFAESYYRETSYDKSDSLGSYYSGGYNSSGSQSDLGGYSGWNNYNYSSGGNSNYGRDYYRGVESGAKDITVGGGVKTLSGNDRVTLNTLTDRRSSSSASGNYGSSSYNVRYAPYSYSNSGSSGSSGSYTNSYLSKNAQSDTNRSYRTVEGPSQYYSSSEQYNSSAYGSANSGNSSSGYSSANSYSNTWGSAGSSNTYTGSYTSYGASKYVSQSDSAQLSGSKAYEKKADGSSSASDQSNGNKSNSYSYGVSEYGSKASNSSSWGWGAGGGYSSSEYSSDNKGTSAYGSGYSYQQGSASSSAVTKADGSASVTSQYKSSGSGSSSYSASAYGSNSSGAYNSSWGPNGYNYANTSSYQSFGSYGGGWSSYSVSSLGNSSLAYDANGNLTRENTQTETSGYLTSYSYEGKYNSYGSNEYNYSGSPGGNYLYSFLMSSGYSFSYKTVSLSQYYRETTYREYEAFGDGGSRLRYGKHGYTATTYTISLYEVYSKNSSQYSYDRNGFRYSSSNSYGSNYSNLTFTIYDKYDSDVEIVVPPPPPVEVVKIIPLEWVDLKRGASKASGKNSDE